MRILGGIIGVLIIFFGISLAFGWWFTVGQAERGILTRYGAIVGDPLQPGLHTKIPWIESYDTINIGTNRTVYGGSEGSLMEAYSRDQQPAHFKISVNWHIPPERVTEVFWRYKSADGLVDTLLDRHVPQQSKNVFGQYNAITLIQDRATFNKQVYEALVSSLKGEPIIIESVQVEDVQFSQDYIDAIKQRMIAEVQVQQLKQQEEQQKVNADITVINATAKANQIKAMADGDAYATMVTAKAQAEATRINGEANAAALQLKGKALAENPRLVDLAIAEKWSGILPTQMVPGSALPFLNLNQALTPPNQ